MSYTMNLRQKQNSWPGYGFQSDNFNSQIGCVNATLDVVKRKVCNQNKECTVAQAQEHRSRGRPKGSRDTSKRI